MPYAERDGAKIYYESRGQGPTLLLLEGLGYGLWMWRGQSPKLEGRFRLLLVDNRGVGDSTPLSGPYSMTEFARDALAVLDAEGVDRAAVLGPSMGGFIAQSIAALAPSRVSALVLSCTSTGGPTSQGIPPETWAEMTRVVPNESAVDRLRRTMSLALTALVPPGTHLRVRCDHRGPARLADRPNAVDLPGDVGPQLRCPGERRAYRRPDAAHDGHGGPGGPVDEFHRPLQGDPERIARPLPGSESPASAGACRGVQSNDRGVPPQVG